MDEEPDTESIDVARVHDALEALLTEARRLATQIT